MWLRLSSSRESIMSDSISQPQVGARAPAFILPASSGGKVRLSDFKGERNVVLYFYPRDNTRGVRRKPANFGTLTRTSRRVTR
ncbi:MAG: redoxin domain-containing protein [Planctomycetaceae bacterium]